MLDGICGLCGDEASWGRMLDFELSRTIGKNTARPRVAPPAPRDKQGNVGMEPWNVCSNWSHARPVPAAAHLMHPAVVGWSQKYIQQKSVKKSTKADYTAIFIQTSLRLRKIHQSSSEDTTSGPPSPLITISPSLGFSGRSGTSSPISASIILPFPLTRFSII